MPTLTRYASGGNPIVGIDSESPELQAIWHSFNPTKDAISFDKSICQSCESLLIRLSAPTENLAAEDQDLTHIRFEHLDGILLSLVVSSQQCPLCHFMLNELNVSHAMVHREYEARLTIKDPRSFQISLDLFYSYKTFQLFQRRGAPNQDESERVLYLEHGMKARIIKAPERFIVSPLWLEQAQAWIADCAEHPQCVGIRPPLPLPKRIFDIHCLDSIHLHVPSGPECFPYATLSYCWGTGVPLKTTTTNLQSHRDKIPFSSFPKTLQDSIQFANALGFRYLWIDALCIIQDDDKDWAEQAAQMTSIYEGCSLNIAVLDFRDCD